MLISLFSHATFGDVRVTDNNGEPWFIAKDIAERLGYLDTADAIRRHCKKSNKITHQGATPTTPPLNLLIIPESDVYRLVMRSQLPEAEKFQDWVCEEVLPAIRKNGAYAAKEQKENSAIDVAHAKQIFGDAIEIAKLCGLQGNQCLLKADKVVQGLLNISPLAMLEIKLLAENNEKLYTPTEIGQQFQMSAIAINLILNKMGLQNQIENKKGHKTWVLTEKGKEFGVYLDTGKSHSNGTPIQQIKWKESVIAELKP